MTTFLVVKNRATSTLNALLSDSALSLTLVSGGGALFPSTYPFHITIDAEILSCTARTGDVLTVTRAAQGTTAAAHLLGATVALNITAKHLDDITTAVSVLENSDTPAVVLGTAAAEGTDPAMLRVDATIVAFDASNPSTQAFDDSPVVGTAVVAARRDHKHGMMSAPSGFNMTNGSYTGDASANKAIAHGLGVIPTLVIITPRTSAGGFSSCLILRGQALIVGLLYDAGYVLAVTIPDATNFYVGNAAGYNLSGNSNTIVYDWVALA